MTLDDMNAALSEALATGRIGVPVSIRLHVQLPEPDADLARVLATIMRVAATVFSGQPERLTARQDADRRQCNVLVQHAGGPTTFVTLGRGSVTRPSLHLLVAGNHGVIRLEGCELFDGSAARQPAAEPDVDRWRGAVAASIASGAAVDLGGA